MPSAASRWPESGCSSIFSSCFTVLVADYAGENYYHAAALLIVPVSGAALPTDILLAAILVKTGQFCQLCVATYLVNVLMVAAGFLWMRECGTKKRNITVHDGRAHARQHHGQFRRQGRPGLFVLFTALLGFSVFATTNIIDKKSGKKEITQKQINDIRDLFLRHRKPRSSIFRTAP